MAPATTVRDKLRRCSLDESSLHLQSTCRNERRLCHLARARYAARAKSARFGLHQGINGSKVEYHFSHSVGELAGGLGNNACKRTVCGALLGFLLAASLFTRHCPPAQSQVAAEAGTMVRATNTSESLTNAPAHAVGSFTQLLKRPHRACLGLMQGLALVASAPLACPLHALSNQEFALSHGTPDSSSCLVSTGKATGAQFHSWPPACAFYASWQMQGFASPHKQRSRGHARTSLNVFLAGTRLALLAWQMCTKEIVNVPAQQRQRREQERARDRQRKRKNACRERERDKNQERKRDSRRERARGRGKTART